MKFSPYSYSKISLYKQCPKKFDFKYIQKLKEPIRDKTPLLKGTCVHSMLESYPDNSDNSLVPEYSYIFDNFLESKYKPLLDLDHTSEEGIGINENMEPTKYKDGKLFRGYIDYYAFIDTKAMIVCDYKTGKYKEPIFQDFNQVMFYALYMFFKYPEVEKIKGMYLYVEHSKDNSIIFERKYLEEYKKELLSSVKSIEEDTEFVEKPQKLCDWCGYKDICLT